MWPAYSLSPLWDPRLTCAGVEGCGLGVTGAPWQAAAPADGDGRVGGAARAEAPDPARLARAFDAGDAGARLADRPARGPALLEEKRGPCMWGLPVGGRHDPVPLVPPLDWLHTCIPLLHRSSARAHTSSKGGSARPAKPPAHLCSCRGGCCRWWRWLRRQRGTARTGHMVR